VDQCRAQCLSDVFRRSLGSLVCVAPFICVPHMCTSLGTMIWLPKTDHVNVANRSPSCTEGKAAEVRDLGKLLW